MRHANTKKRRNSGESRWKTSALRRHAGRLGDERGVAMVEFALLATALMLILIGIVYFGRYLNYSTDETHLAHVAARWAAVDTNPGSGTLQSYVQQQADSTELRSGSGDVTQAVQVWIYPNSGGSVQVSQPLKACVKATFHFLPFLGAPDITVTKSATMRAEAIPTTWVPDGSHPPECDATP